MTELDIQRIEEALARRLPRSFVRFMLAYPEVLQTTCWTIEDDDGNSYTQCPADMEFNAAAQSIIELNKSDHKLNNWPEGFLVIGGDAGGGVYAIDLDIEHSPVYFAEPSSGYFDPAIDGVEAYFQTAAKSLEQFRDDLVCRYKSDPYYDPGGDPNVA